AVREAVDLETDAGLESDFEDRVEVEGVLRPVVEDPSLRVAQRRRVRAPHRLGHDLRQLLLAPALARMQADLDPVELSQRGLGKIEPSVREDVALDAAQDDERGEPLVHGGDLLALPAEVVRVEAGYDPHVARV